MTIHSYKIRSVLLLLVAALSLWLFIMVANRYALRPKADVNTVVTQFNPASVVIEDASPLSVQFSIVTAEQSGIMGIDAVFHIQGPVKLTQNNPLSSSSETATFTSLAKTDNRFSYTTVATGAQLPSTVTMPLQVSCTGVGQATVELDVNRSQFVGTAQGNIFGINPSNTLSVNWGGARLLGLGAPANAKFEPATQSAPVGQNFIYRLVLTPGGETSISAFNVAMKFDPTIVEVVEVKEPVGGGSVGAPPIPPTSQPGNGTPPANVAPPGAGTDASINGATCTVDTDCPTCVGSSITGCQMKCQAGVCQPSGGGATTPSTAPNITPAIPQPTSDGGNPSCSTDSDCSARCGDPTSLICQSLRCVEGTCQKPTDGGATPGQPIDGGERPGPVPFTRIKNDIDPEAGTIDLAYVINAPDTLLPKSVVIEVVLKGKKNGRGTLDVTKADMTGNVDGSNYEVSLSPATYTIGEANGSPPGGDPKTVNLNLKLRFQGVTGLPSAKTTIPVKIGLGDGIDNTVYETGDFTANSSGVWSGSVTFSIPVGSGYKILVKGPHHLQKRICDAEPKDDDVGGDGYYNCDRGNINIAEGDNTFDFSKAAILVGDLIPQDGIVNAHDRILCTENLGKTTAEALTAAEVNYDGGVNQIDCAAILYSMTIRHDEK